MSYNVLLFDWETLGNKPSSVVLDLAAVVFNIDELDKFEDLTIDEDRTFRVKFDAREQLIKYGRTSDPSTVDWWKKQGEEAQKVLKPGKTDVSLKEGMAAFIEFIKRHGIDTNKNAIAYVRGQSFDFPIMVDVLSDVMPDIDYTRFPVPFWCQRDVRTAISHDLSTPNNTKCPLPKGIFQGFVAHNSVHDCARDAISLQHCWGYKNGTIEIPEEFDIY